ncbi:MAG: hypothetical protein JO128_22165 [Alphaproteobacteria bacterium]|nr:hypothetical protein [Alphaproteobacteria bacterium]
MEPPPLIEPLDVPVELEPPIVLLELPIDPPVDGDVVLLRFERVVEGTCDCCLVERFFEFMVSDEPEEEPDDRDGDEPDMLPDDDCAKAVPATSRAAAAVTISVRMENPLRGWVWRFASALSQLFVGGFVPRPLRNPLPWRGVDLRGIAVSG